MTTYLVRTGAGESIQIMASSVAEAARKLLEQFPGVSVLSITPMAAERAADQQA